MSIETELKTNSMYYTIELIRGLSSTKAKKELLKTAVEHRPMFKEMLYATYNPHIQYFIRKIPEDHTKGRYFSFDLEKLMKRPDYFLGVLSNRVKTGHAAEDYVVYLLENMPEDDGKVLELILARDLKCGINVKSINSVCPGLIPEYPCMLGYAYKDAIIDEDSFFPCYSQIKYDGLRANIIVRKNTSGKKLVETKGRSGKNLGVPDYFYDAVPVLPYQYVLDGEIVVLDANGTTLPRQKGNGIINKYAKGTITDNERTQYTIKFHAWDIIIYEDFLKGESPDHYQDRLEALESIEKDFDGEKIEVVHTILVNSMAEAQEEFEKRLLAGEEGIMIKNRDAMWKSGRQKSIIKLKGEQVCELYIKRVVEGKGRLKGKLGAFLCESEDGLLEVSVGSGFNDDQRVEYFDEDLIGKVISVKFNEVIRQEKRTPEYSLFLPIFIELRHDKDTANTLAEIKS